MHIKRLFLVIGLLSISIQLFSQNEVKDSLSYALGVQIGESLKQGKMLERLDIQVFSMAIESVLKDKPGLTQEECRRIITAHLEREANALKERNMIAGNTFLDKNKTQTGVIVAPSGLQYKILKEGTGANPTEDDEVEVHYKGTLVDGRVFDSSYERNETVKFPLARVINGWKEGLRYVKEGGKIMLYVPAPLAYGERSPQGSIIEPNSTLIFEIDLIKILPKAADQGLITPRPINPPTDK